MPIVSSSYQPRGAFRNTHFSTIYSAKIRSIPKLVQSRERLELPDSDFLDLDFSFAHQATANIAVLLHGLEGNAQRTYIKGQGKVLVENGWDVCAVNYRGCSGEPNRQYKSYNAGKTDDLEEIIQYLRNKDKYRNIALIGFSLGGNLLLKYLGERTDVPKEISYAVAVSSPLSLKGSLEALTQFHNWVYRTSFLYHLRKKYMRKVKRYPDLASSSEAKKIKSLLAFDNIYTAPAHGFKDAFEYYKKNSCLQFLPHVEIPTLILNAGNDSFLSPHCYPRELASKLKNLYLEIPQYGGHVGFYQPKNTYYNETRALKFLQEQF
ncbi:MAG: alpha/beta fold hydrolase [Bacteroidia bacterium]|nr:alpha/beta fold hydrolase [Bacteroidia bacterium]NNF30651.1 alpha/beta fold hydrolase [Flavobacteriaceae bacterium]MBT8274875.1 alpha/beta fold hydrolase [Bacteroidia bacterium]NNJ80694.1 alpha/beta fold hydrolase [Flavobacteriaceae bacterium]NNK54904.1 alpha/beta fold hydrolase [Flavobacteriaceae bacterium]